MNFRNDFSEDVRRNSLFQNLGDFRFVSQPRPIRHAAKDDRFFRQAAELTNRTSPKLLKPKLRRLSRPSSAPG